MALRRIRILMGCCGDTDPGSGVQPFYAPGDEVEIRAELAQRLVSANQAKFIDEEVRATKAGKKVETETQEAPEHAARTGRAGR